MKFNLSTRIKFVLFPDERGINLFDSNIVDVMRFRRRHFSLFDIKYNRYISYDYKVFHSAEFFKTFYDFIASYGSVYFFYFSNNFFLRTSKSNGLLSYFCVYFFFKKNFSYIFSKFFYKDFDQCNLIKIYYIWHRLFIKLAHSTVKIRNIPLSNVKEISLYNLKKFSGWNNFFKFISSYSFKKPNTIFMKPLNKNVFIPYDFVKWALMLKKNVVIYSEICSKIFSKEMYKLIYRLRRVRLDLNKMYLVIVNDKYIYNLKRIFPIHFNNSSSDKFINLNKLNNYLFFFLRKNRIFNKGRYSRNRQTYRTGFYWCLWLNIFVVYGLHFVFYRFTFTFGYLWFLLFVLFGSFLFPKVLKYNLFKLDNLLFEFKNFLKLIFYIINLILNNAINFLISSRIFENFLEFLKNDEFYFENSRIDDFYSFLKKKKIIFSESEIVEDIIQDNIVDGGNFDFDIKNQFIDFFKKFK